MITCTFILLASASSIKACSKIGNGDSDSLLCNMNYTEMTSSILAHRL